MFSDPLDAAVSVEVIKPSFPVLRPKLIANDLAKCHKAGLCSLSIRKRRSNCPGRKIFGNCILGSPINKKYETMITPRNRTTREMEATNTENLTSGLRERLFEPAMLDLTNFNVTPEFCSFTIDRRLNPEENLDEEKRRLRDALEGFEIGALQEEPATATSPGNQLGILLARHITNVTGREPSFELCPGLLETRFYAARGIPAFAYGPGLLTVSHGPNEFVPIRNISQCALVYALTAAEMLP
jgi:acetylornithine deacetylase/succinyl-diaminopimelate desuccinylase-like protein